MTEKVKVTEFQQRLVNSIKEDTSIKNLFYRARDMDFAQPDFGKMSDEQLLHAWLGVAEVEPELRDGDFFYYRESDQIGEVKDVFVHWSDGMKTDVNYAKELIMDGDIRHATESEIAQEKERRWWSKHGREVWEISEDDILEYLGYLYIIDCFDSEEVYLKNSIDRKTNYSKPFSFVKKHFKVVCLSGNRLDISHE